MNQPSLITAILKGMKGSRLDFALSSALPGHGLRARQRLCKNGGVRAGAKTLSSGFILPSDDFQVQLLLGPDDFCQGRMEETKSPSLRPPGIFLVAVNRNFAAIAKPPGLATARIKGASSQSLEGLLPGIWPELLHEYAQETRDSLGDDLPSLPVPMTVNRLDGLTSGLVMTAFGRDNAALFRRHESAGEVEKLYYALVRGLLNEDLLLDKRLDMRNRDKTLVLDEVDPDKLRHSRVNPLKTFSEPGGSVTLVRVCIKRGARHQIRAHLANAGFPICGDVLYTFSGSVSEKSSFNDRLYLHHAHISFPGFSADLAPGWSFNYTTN